MKTTMLLLLCMSSLACKRNIEIKANTATKVKTISDTIYTDVKGKSYKFLVQIPDSLRTTEQKRLINLINDVAITYISVKNNHMILELSKAGFLAKGIPERYYEILLKNLIDNNAYFDSKGIKNIEELVRKSKNDYKKYQLLNNK